MVKLGVFEKMKTRENITAQELAALVDVDSNVIGQTVAESLVDNAD